MAWKIWPKENPGAVWPVEDLDNSCTPEEVVGIWAKQFDQKQMYKYFNDNEPETFCVQKISTTSIFEITVIRETEHVYHIRGFQKINQALSTAKKAEEIKKLVEAAIIKINNSRFWTTSYDNEPINWADLSCVSVELIFQEGANPYWGVTIEEAGPDGCTNFCKAIREEVPDVVQVRTEW